MKKPELLVLIGLPASGKSVEAVRWQNEDPDGRVRVNYDDLRLGMYGEGWVWNRKDEEAMKANARRIVTAALRARLSVVVDNTNLSRHVRAGWQDLGRDLGADYREYELDTPLDECIRRDRARGPKACTCNVDDADDLMPVVRGNDGNLHSPSCPSLLPSARVGQAVIDGMALRYGMLDWDACECPGQTGPEAGHRSSCPKGRPIAIVDIDSTLADDNGRLRHITPPPRCKCAVAGECGCPEYAANQQFRKDWGAYFAEVANDVPILPMVRLLERLHDHIIVRISGRPVSNGATPVGILTEDWLVKHHIPFDRLFLKTRDFHQKSPDFKQSILEYLPKDRVAYVFDDDPACLSMYRSEGLYALGVPGSGKR